ncbi:MAG: transglutaminase domain-containing protein, partial [Deltaproteobacteria bacterium]|nr:transglutaminase domain-containing protein [Deltaproteobacteria bacterium]
RSKHAGADDPVASFLFGDRTGYCIHIAHAAVYLLRSLGVPARVGAGYTVDEAHAGGGSSLLLRGGNAHAWPELYLRGFGWVVVDPTPERSEEPSLAPPDSVQQRMLGEMARSQQQGKGAGQAQQPDPREGPWDLLSLLYLLPWALLAAMLALLLLLYAVKLWRRAAPALRGGPELTRIAYRAASDRLAELGWRRRVGEPRPSFARRVERLSPAYLPLSEACEAACLGWPRPAQPEMLVRDLLRRQAGELDAAFPRWRRLLGLLDPTSWLRTR